MCGPLSSCALARNGWVGLGLSVHLAPGTPAYDHVVPVIFWTDVEFGLVHTITVSEA